METLLMITAFIAVAVLGIILVNRKSKSGKNGISGGSANPSHDDEPKYHNS